MKNIYSKFFSYSFVTLLLMSTGGLIVSSINVNKVIPNYYNGPTIQETNPGNGVVHFSDDYTEVKFTMHPNYANQTNGQSGISSNTYAFFNEDYTTTFTSLQDANGNLDRSSSSTFGVRNTSMGIVRIQKDFDGDGNGNCEATAPSNNRECFPLDWGQFLDTDGYEFAVPINNLNYGWLYNIDIATTNSIQLGFSTSIIPPTSFESNPNVDPSYNLSYKPLDWIYTLNVEDRIDVTPSIYFNSGSFYFTNNYVVGSVYGISNHTGQYTITSTISDSDTGAGTLGTIIATIELASDGSFTIDTIGSDIIIPTTYFELDGGGEFYTTKEDFTISTSIEFTPTTADITGGDGTYAQYKETFDDVIVQNGSQIFLFSTPTFNPTIEYDYIDFGIYASGTYTQPSLLEAGIYDLTVTAYDGPVSSNNPVDIQIIDTFISDGTDWVGIPSNGKIDVSSLYDVNGMLIDQTSEITFEIAFDADVGDSWDKYEIEYFTLPNEIEYAQYNDIQVDTDINISNEIFTLTPTYTATSSIISTDGTYDVTLDILDSNSTSTGITSMDTLTWTSGVLTGTQNSIDVTSLYTYDPIIFAYELNDTYQLDIGVEYTPIGGSKVDLGNAKVTLTNNNGTITEVTKDDVNIVASIDISDIVNPIVDFIETPETGINAPDGTVYTIEYDFHLLATPQTSIDNEIVTLEWNRSTGTFINKTGNSSLVFTTGVTLGVWNNDYEVTASLSAIGLNLVVVESWVAMNGTPIGNVAQFDDITITNMLHSNGTLLYVDFSYAKWEEIIAPAGTYKLIYRIEDDTDSTPLGEDTIHYNGSTLNKTKGKSIAITEYIKYDQTKWIFTQDISIFIDKEWMVDGEGTYESLGTEEYVVSFTNGSVINANLPIPSSDDLGIITQVVETTNDNGDTIYVIENKYTANEGILDGTYTITTTIDIEDYSVTSGIQTFTDVVVVENEQVTSTTRQDGVVINITEFGVVDENNYFVPNDGIVIESTENIILVDENQVLLDLGDATPGIDNIINSSDPAQIIIDSSGLSTGALIGIIVGSVVGAILIGLGIWFGIKRRYN